MEPLPWVSGTSGVPPGGTLKFTGYPGRGEDGAISYGVVAPLLCATRSSQVVDDVVSTRRDTGCPLTWPLGEKRPWRPGEPQPRDVYCTEPSDERTWIDPVPRQANWIQYGLVGTNVGSPFEPSAYVSPTNRGSAPNGKTGLRLGKSGATASLL